MKQLVALALLLLACIAVFCLVTAVQAGVLPPCGTSAPLTIVLPDGTEVPARGVTYDTATRRIRVLGDARVFCDRFE